MKMFVTLTVFLMLTGCATNGDWSRADTTREVIVQLGVLADGIQTYYIHKKPGYYEANTRTAKIIGNQPEPDNLLMYIGTYAISHYLIARALPPKWRKYYQYASIYSQWKTVRENCLIDLGC